MQGTAFKLFMLLAMMFIAHNATVESSPFYARGDFQDELEDELRLKINRQVLLDLINGLEQDLIARRELAEAQKRGLDFGISRGYSGSEMAKHKIGMAAASNPWGPGRKKRSPGNNIPKI